MAHCSGITWTARVAMQGLDAIVLVAPAIIGRNKRRQLSNEQDSSETSPSTASSARLSYVDEQTGTTGSVTPSR